MMYTTFPGHLARLLPGLSLCAASLIAAPAWGDSLFNQEASKGGTLVSQKVSRFEVGDIITVMVRESLNADTSAETNTDKKNKIDMQAPIAANPLLVGNPPEGPGIFNPGELPNVDIETKNKAQNTGSTSRKNTLTTSISCFVTQIFPNGNVELRGEKRVTVNRDDSIIEIVGIVRSKDVTPENTVLSSQVANAQVMVKGKGPLWNNQRRGLLTKFLDWFSPF
ncbi:MAG: flagellar basal body L-ring protein FlgH [Candidatus Hydrogenedentes bacterium]|nr:flagellar basal body L-ring protein FlgH [Candidatus Hydrogenedentota bacterium]